MYPTLREQAESSSPSPPGGEGRGEERRALVPARGAGEVSSRPRKLSFKEQRELEGMEGAILVSEERKAALEATLSDPATLGLIRFGGQLDYAAYLSVNALSNSPTVAQ